MSGKVKGSKNAVIMRKYPSYRRRKEFWDGPRSAMVLLMLMGSILAAGIIAYNYDYYGLKDKVNISLLTPSEIRQNGQFAMVVTATDVNGDPVSELPIKLILEGLEGSGGEWTLFEGKTDSHGLLMPEIDVPDYNGTADIRCYCGVEQVVGHVDVLDKVEAQPAKARIVINTDKPMYQPGQSVHIRALAFEGVKPMATAKPMTILIKDPQNNKIFRETLQPSVYGIIGLDLPLSDQLPLGEYELRVSLDNMTYAEKTFEVKRYVLPKFHITVEGTRNWYVADEDISGTINITYMFGKKVDGLVTVTLKDKYDDSGYNDWEDGGGIKAGDAARSTDDDGRDISYGAELYNATLTLSGGKADFTVSHNNHSPNFNSAYNYWYSTQTKVLTVTVTDTADHTETKDYEITVATEPFSVLVYSDTHMMDETSYYYLVVSTPNGLPVEGAAVSFTYQDQVKTAVSDVFGIAEVTFTYQGEGDANIKITKDSYVVDKSYYLFGESAMKVHSAKVLYKPGDVAVFDIKTSVRDARLPNMVATYEVTASDIIVDSGTVTLGNGDGGSAATIPITEAMAPAAQLTIYILDENGNVQSDTTIFAVEETSDLNVAISTDKGVYKPGTPAKIDFKVTDGATNNGVMTALGVRIIDWSVLELSERLVSTDEVFHGVMDQTMLEPEEQTAVFISDCGGEARKLGDGMGGAVATDCIGTPALTGIVYDHGDPSTKPATQFMSSYEMSLKDGDEMKGDAVAMFWAAAFSMGLVGLLGLVYASTRASMKSALPVLAVLLTAMLTGGLTAFMVLDLQNGSKEDQTSGDKSGVQSNERLWDMKRGAWGGGNGMEDMGGGGASAASGGGKGSDKDGAPPPSPTGASSTGSAVRVRDWFPETWYWNQELITDETGHASIDLVTPDTITTWGIDAWASTPDAMVGVGSKNLTVFQDFFIDPDLPESVVRGDVFDLPIAVYNYLGEDAVVTVTLKQDAWFDLVSGSNVRSMSLASDSVGSVHFTVKAKEVGENAVTVTGVTATAQDIVKKDLRVVPDGYHVLNVFNGELKDMDVSSSVIFMNASRVPDSENAYVKLEGSLTGVALDGADRYIQFVTGCGEQSTSRLAVDISAYRNLQLGDGDRALVDKYEDTITEGIQYEMQYVHTFDDGTKAIVWWNTGDEEKGDDWLTGWGIFAFQDLTDAGFYVDETIIPGLQSYIVSKQHDDGSWIFPSEGHWSIKGDLTQDDIAATAYMVRALKYSNYVNDDHIYSAVRYIEKNIRVDEDSPYTLSLALLALEMAGGSKDKRNEIATRIMEFKVLDPTTHWEYELSGSGDHCSDCTDNTIETTAYAIMAISAHGGYEGDVAAAVKHLLMNRDDGVWGTTHNTAVAFQALNSEGKFEVEDMDLTVTADGFPVKNLHMDKANNDLVYYVDLRPYLSDDGATEVRVQSAAGGKGTLLYQVIYEEYIPWDVWEQNNSMPLTISVNYSKTDPVPVGEVVDVQIDVMYSGDEEVMKMLMVEIEAPTGMSLMEWEFSEMLCSGVLKQYDFYGNSADLYFEDISTGSKISVSYGLTADSPGDVTLQGVKAYNMYNDDLTAVAPPVEMVIE